MKTYVTLFATRKQCQPTNTPLLFVPLIALAPHSFGKGLIQGVYGLKDGGGVVVTVAEYVTPRGGVIQGEGIRGQVDGWDGVKDVLSQCKSETPPMFR